MKNSLAILILLAAFAVSCRMDNKIAAKTPTGSEPQIELLVSPTPVNSPAAETILINDIDSKIGIVDLRGDGIGCLRTKRGDLDAQTPVAIIFSLDEPPPKVLSAKVEKKLDKSCARRASETGDKNPGENYFYSLTYENADDAEIIFDVGIAVIKPAKAIKIQENLASVDLDEDGKSEFFRRCTGFEGIHFTIWTGKPLKGKRIWHSFYYLDYDTKADCRKKDWKGTEDF